MLIRVALTQRHPERLADTPMTLSKRTSSPTSLRSGIFRAYLLLEAQCSSS
jgi:hypothetical protein